MAAYLVVGADRDNLLPNYPLSDERVIPVVREKVPEKASR